MFSIRLLLLFVKLSILAVLFLALSAEIVDLVTRRAEALGKHVVAENKRLRLRRWESINALQLVHSFARERYEIDRFREISVPGPLSDNRSRYSVPPLIS